MSGSSSLNPFWNKTVPQHKSAEQMKDLTEKVEELGLATRYKVVVVMKVSPRNCHYAVLTVSFRLTVCGVSGLVVVSDS